MVEGAYNVYFTSPIQPEVVLDFKQGCKDLQVNSLQYYKASFSKDKTIPGILEIVLHNLLPEFSITE